MYWWYTWTLALACPFAVRQDSDVTVSCVVVPHSHHGSTDLAAVFRKLDRTWGSESDQVRTGECRNTACANNSATSIHKRHAMIAHPTAPLPRYRAWLGLATTVTVV